MLAIASFHPLACSTAPPQVPGGLSQYNTIKVINFIRKHVAEGKDPLAALEDLNSFPWDNDVHLQPVLENDEFLFHDWEEEAGGEALLAGSVIGALEQENIQLKEALRTLQELVLTDLEEDEKSEKRQQPQEREDANRAIDETYFDSYSYFDIHRDMLSDRVRTEAYQKALSCNPSLIEGASVLDVGCGTGILSMFAAKAGASHVIALDASEKIACIAQANVSANGLGPDKVQVLQGRVEDLAVRLPRVDILMSEWMGYALLFESMLDSVLFARDHCLKPGGALLPDKATLYVAAADWVSTGLDFWDDVYGFSMKPIQDSLKATALKEAVVRSVDTQNLVSAPAALKEFDLATMAVDDQDFSSEFQFQFKTATEVYSLVLWFSTEFSDRFCGDTPVVLDTSPYQTQTHWVQTVLVLPQPVSMVPGGRLGGVLTMNRTPDRHRSLDIVLECWSSVDEGGEREEESQTLVYTLKVRQ